MSTRYWESARGDLTGGGAGGAAPRAELPNGCKIDLQVLDLVEGRWGWGCQSRVPRAVGWAPPSPPSPTLRLRAEVQRQVPAWGGGRGGQPPLTGEGGDGDSALCLTGSWEGSRWQS